MTYKRVSIRHSAILRIPQMDRVNWTVAVLQTSAGRVGAREQVAQRSAPPQRQPDPAPVFRPVVQQVTALAERPDVTVFAAAMGGIMVEMSCRQHHPGRAD